MGQLSVQKCVLHMAHFFAGQSGLQWLQLTQLKNNNRFRLDYLDFSDLL